jgi:hypothetical protein
VKPTLKKVSKMAGQFAKLKKNDQVKTLDFKANLKTVEKRQYVLDDEVMLFCGVLSKEEELK